MESLRGGVRTHCPEHAVVVNWDWNVVVLLVQQTVHGITSAPQFTCCDGLLAGTLGGAPFGRFWYLRFGLAGAAAGGGAALPPLPWPLLPALRGCPATAAAAAAWAT